ncbi:MAG TPA: hypothetical protein VKA18_02255 [Alphaproteobacteria bacterium]|nr:hypothetical protein [Alphaproteobacteria bacterium]
MSAAELEVLLLGLLRLWQVEAQVSSAPEKDRLTARIERRGEPVLAVSWQVEPFGVAWKVTQEGKRQRTYPSVIGLIRHLRHSLAPERDAARVLFAASSAKAE